MIANVVKDLTAVVRDTLTASPKVSGTVYVAIRLELDGDADDGLFWDTTAGGDWVAGGSVAAWPQATYTAAGLWVYQFPAAATTGKTAADKPGRITWRMTDNVATPASETASSGLAEEPIYVADAYDPASDTTQVRGFTTAGKAEIEAEAVDALTTFGPATSADVANIVTLLLGDGYSGAAPTSIKGRLEALPSEGVIADTLLAETVDGVALSTVLSRLNAMARGKVVKTGDAYAYKAQDGTTTLFTLTIAAGERTTA